MADIFEKRSHYEGLKRKLVLTVTEVKEYTDTHRNTHTYLMVQPHDLQSLFSLSSHLVLRSQNQPKNWTDGMVSVSVCVHAYVWIRIHLCLSVCVKMLEMENSPAAELLTVIHALCTRAQTRTHTHTPLLKRHIQWIYTVLSCCLLWMGTAA